MRNKRMWQLIAVCISLFVFHGVLFSQTRGKISGTVKDAETGEPLPGANVILNNTTMGAATDKDGFYYIVNIPPGSYSETISMIGYERVTKTEVLVNVNRTTTVDFDLKATTIAGAEVTIVAERDIVMKDVSASSQISAGEQITQVPIITDLEQFIGLQAGIEGDFIRGGGLDQTQFMVDGLVVVDNRTNQPMMLVNLSAIQEINIIQGGFNAEYGNVRSGLINVVTKEGSRETYNGSFDGRLSDPTRKHFGPSIFDPESFYLRPYLDPAVAFVGTDNGTWTDEEKEQNLTFRGWNAVSAELLGDADPTNDMTPEEAQMNFIWRHTALGKPEWGLPSAEELGQRPRNYGDKPDWNTDVSFSGPVPGVGRKLGGLRFFGSYRTVNEMFTYPMSRDFYREKTGQLKLTSNVTSTMKVTVEGLLGKIESVHNGNRFARENYFTSSNNSVFAGNGVNTMYWPGGQSLFDIDSYVLGLSLDHVLSPSTFYNLSVSYVDAQTASNGFDDLPLRSLEEKRKFGSVSVDETPYGWHPSRVTLENELVIGGEGGAVRNNSSVSTLNVKFDLTSQLGRYHQVKAGIQFNYDDIITGNEYDTPAQPDLYTATSWEQSPYRFGAYIQDKIEFQGMIANLGVRLDYNNPNADWFSLEDPYNRYFKAKFRDVFQTEAPKAPTDGQVKISPRLGISHPISDNAKLYFNYGHFYSMPTSNDMYRIEFGSTLQGIQSIGNPNADLPRTVAYELGADYNVSDLFLLHVAGYYKDVTRQTGNVNYVSFDGSVDYSTVVNKNYADIRGLEIRLDKRFGRWVSGWLNYNYLVTTNGDIGRATHYQDPRLERIQGLEDPDQERPIAQPIFRANLILSTPRDFGPALGSFRPLANIQLSTLYTWKAGRYQTWDPLETFELENNLQWRAEQFMDVRFSKAVSLGRYDLRLTLDVQNLFNTKYMQNTGFFDAIDQNKYLESLHLPLYEGEEYQAAGFMPGNDKPGDVKSADKPYINMPNLNYATFFNPRSVLFGLRVYF